MTRAWSSVLLVATLGCAQIKTTSQVEVVPRAGAAEVFGAPEGELTTQEVEVAWQQNGAALEVDLSEARTCVSVRHVPVTRVEKIERKAGQAVYWEYAIAGALLAVGIAALVKPEAFGPKALDENGTPVEDKRVGYTLGGVFVGLGTVALGMGVADTVRARDEVRHTDAYRVERGEPVPCRGGDTAIAEREVELIVGSWRRKQTTDAKGHARWDLPALSEIEAPLRRPLVAAAPATAPAPAGEPITAAPSVAEPSVAEPSAAEPQEVSALVRVDRRRAVRVRFVIPYDAAVDAPSGRTRLPAESPDPK